MYEQSAAQAAYLARQKQKSRRIAAARWAILAGLMILWEIAARLSWIDPFIFSCPSRVLACLSRLCRQGELWEHLLTTLWETVVGFTLGTVLGTVLAIAFWASDTASRIVDPYLVILNALPKVALGPVLIVWIGAGTGAIIAMALMVSLVVSIMGMLQGFRSVDEDKLLLLRTLGANRWQELTKVVLPANIPTMIATLKINVGMSWVGVIVGEFLVSKRGLGYLITYGGQVFQLDLVMASTLLLAVAAGLMYWAVAALEARYRRRHP